MTKYHTFRSNKYPDNAITIGERDDGTYFIPSASESINPEFNSFDSIEQIEVVLEDTLTLIIPNKQVN